MSGSGRQVVQLSVRLRVGGLAEPVDPDRAQVELARRLDVVEQARGDVDVMVTVGSRRLEETLPVSVGGLVGPDVLGDDREVDRHAKPPLRGFDQVAIGVREDGEHPASVAQLGKGGRNLGERRPVRQRVRQRAGLTLGKLDALFLLQPFEGERRHLAIGAERLRLRFDLALNLVVALEESRRILDAEEPLELPLDPEVPVDQGAVAVESGPALRRHDVHPS